VEIVQVQSVHISNDNYWHAWTSFTYLDNSGIEEK